jgi:hypothetical protein
MADTYVVTGQAEALDTSDVTNPVRVMRVTFKSLANNTIGTVSVPLSDYTPAEVAKRIEAYVATIDAVHGL